MIGTMLSVVVVFAILLLMTNAAGYYRRGRLRVADTEGGDVSVRRSAAIGSGMGLIALLLLFVLYFGITRWEWLGTPASNGSPAVLSPAPKESPAPGLGAVATPPPAGPALASPSPTH